MYPQKNFTAAAIASDTLMTRYAAQPTLAKEIHLVAETYTKTGQRKKAFDLYQANVQRAGKAEVSFKPGSIWEDPEFFRMRSQEEMIYYYLDQESTDKAFSLSLEMLNRYSKQSLVVKETGYILSRLIRENKMDEALRLCEAVLSQFPANPNIIWIKGSRVLIDIKNNNLQSADTRLKTMQQEYKTHSEYAEVMAWMGLECCYVGQHAKAIELSEHVLSLNPPRPTQLYCLMTLARANVNLENDNKVQEYINTILSNYKNPEDNSAGYISAIGEEYYLVGQKTDKEDKFNKSVALLDSILAANLNKQVVAEIQYLLGLNYRYLGSYMKAAESLEAACSADPEYIHAEYCLFAAGDSYEKSLKQNLVSETEGKAAVRRIYTQFAQSYPDSRYISLVSDWLKKNRITRVFKSGKKTIQSEIADGK
jgi:tetratricopeptide (TPR) repeat protein